MTINTPYKHIYCKDVAFLIVNIEQLKTSLNLKGKWINVSTKNWYPIITDTFTIEYKDVKNWKEINIYEDH